MAARIGGAASAAIIDADTIREHQVDLMQHLNLSSLVPRLRKHKLLSEKDLARVEDTKHHGTVERTGFLLYSLYNKDQSTIDTFVQCLREAQDHPGHKTIIKLLEEGLPDQPERSPIFEILDARMEDVIKMVNITAFLNTLANTGSIKVSTFLDLANPDRTVEENLQRLLLVLEEKGTRGFIDFLSCLRNKYTPSHEDLFKLLFKEVHKFFKEHPKRGQISRSDKIEILQLDTRGKALEDEVLKLFNANIEQLKAELNVKELLPYLEKHHVLSEDEALMLTDKSLKDRAQQNLKLIELLQSRPPFWIVKFTECLRESGKHKSLLEVLLPASGTLPADQDERVVHKKDKVLVIVDLQNYVEVNVGYKLTNYPPGGPKEDKDENRLEDERTKLRDFFIRLEFEVIELPLVIESGVKREDEEERGGGGRDSHESRLSNAFFNTVTSRCTEEAIVVIYISGIQFPLKLESGEERKDFSGAILLSGASTVSRKEMDYLTARDILAWLTQLPQAHITVVVDCEQNFVSRFGKQREPELVEILDDPWSSLTSSSTSTVVFYLRPDIRAMAQLRTKDVRRATGMLTEGFNFALRHCCARRVTRGAGGQDGGLSHRKIYEAMSFYWHRRGRQHRAFVPAVRGDVCREFLGKRSFPYQQVFRVDLVRSGKEGEIFDYEKLHVQTGTMAGIIYGDVLEVFHPLRPGFKVQATVAQSYPLNAILAIENQEALKRLRAIVEEIYQEKEGGLQTKDGSTEFLLAYKIFPVHERVLVGTEGLTDGESAVVRSATQSSAMLGYAPKLNNAHLVVKRSSGLFMVEDKFRDVTVEQKTKKLGAIASFLEQIAWYKYVKKLKSGNKASMNHFKCFLTAEKPLLHVAVPLCEEFNIKWSSFDNVPPSSKGHEVILQATDTQKFWTPSPPMKDPNPCLEVEFKDNHVVTTVEVKGDYNQTPFVEEADIYHQKDVWSRELDGPTKENPDPFEKFSVEEAVQFVTITPLVLGAKDFSISIRLTCKMMSTGTKILYKPVQNFTVINWGYYQSRTGWKISPTPSPNGQVDLHSAGREWIDWSGRTNHPLIFDLGMSGYRLEKIEFKTVGDANCINKLLVRLQSSWKKEDFPKITSVWPFKHEFPMPLVLSNIQLWPKEPPLPPSSPQPTPGPSRIKVQMQLYGNKHNKPVEVEEGDILTFHFCNFTQTPQFVYILCLEETGEVKSLMMDVAEPKKEKKTAMVMKKLIQTYIPEGCSEFNQIKDIYKVFICQRKMYLDPFVQESLLNYNKPCCYSICALGHKDVRKEVWYDFTFEVIVKRSTSRK